jgi:hypothetical protein
MSGKIRNCRFRVHHSVFRYLQQRPSQTLPQENIISGICI